VKTSLEMLAGFAARAECPADARARAAVAVLDTVGVALAGAAEPASRIVRDAIGAGCAGPETAAAPLVGPCRVWGTAARASAGDAALANGTAAHALDYDDMCFVSLAHPSAPLVPAIVAIGELVGASGRAVLDSYVVGFEIQARLGRLMNPRHYGRGWHCTSTLGTISAAAGAARLLGLDEAATAHALAIAASSASGLKENFGTMVKPLHAGLAARNGVMAALMAKGGLTGSAKAIDGPQGFLHAMDSERDDLASETADVGSRWEILSTGVTVKLYPSCAGTHPSLDALLDLRAREGFTAEDVERIEIDVDPVVPTILIYDRPASALEGKFSMPFCAAAAIVLGRVGIDTFDEERIRDPRIGAVMSRVAVRVDDRIGHGRPPLTEARVQVRLRSGRTLVQEAHGARGYPSKPASDAELATKYLACAAKALPLEKAEQTLDLLGRLESLDDVRDLSVLLSTTSGVVITSS